MAKRSSQEPAQLLRRSKTKPGDPKTYRFKGSFKGSFKGYYKGSIEFRVLGLRGLLGDPKTYRFKGSTLYLRGHNLLFCRVWGHRKPLNPKPLNPKPPKT